MTTRPRVSAVAAIFNASAYLEESLPKLIAEVAEVDGELILVDDGSSDDSLRVIERVVGDDARVVLVRLEVNQGVARARRAGLARASGDFVWFVDIDDDWDATLLSSMVGLAESAAADVVICDADYVYPSGLVRPVHPTAQTSRMDGREAVERLLSGVLKGHLWNKLFSRVLIESIEVPPSEVHSDLTMTSSYLAAATTVIFTDQVKYRYLVRPGSIIQSGRRRAQSLAIVEGAVRTATQRVGIDPPLVEDFVHRFFLLSAIKDSYNPRYSPQEAREARRRARARISVATVVTRTVRVDRRRAVALLLLKFAPFATPVIVRKM
ncbi:glycosyltransferase [Microbacterium hominis]|uniref:glycosyltransferase n=1 Tax=Microbacterium TaxID=33882 RepID=UPI00168BE7F6|nr:MULTISPECIES: glycosyltransferase [Microbacterium]QOC26400.1 glycosyltransferase [Microbacterium hominis]QOC27583.1 glycosyltransferase [Microbacterium hominis]QYF97292.1 glycosyltransferase [Microbacterium sp. PAMC21962]